MSHTPAPWRIERYTGHPHIEIYGRISKTSNIPQRVCSLQDLMGEAEANAALISAAPDMLSALKYWFDSKADPKKLAKIARSAIAKAEGR